MKICKNDCSLIDDVKNAVKSGQENRTKSEENSIKSFSKSKCGRFFLFLF